MKLALLPVNVRIGDFEGNLKIHRTRVKEAVAEGASFLVFPELSLVGYLPKDLLTRPDWQKRAETQLEDFHAWLRAEYPKIGVVVGTTLATGATRGLANGAVFLHGAEREDRAKTLIPYYDVFHESRYFDAATALAESYRAPISFAGKKIGLLICEDSWHEMQIRGRKIYSGNPTAQFAGADLIVNLSASPYDQEKKARRRATLQKCATEVGVPIAYVNHFGGHDDILFDGDAFFVDAKGQLRAEKMEAGKEPLLLRLDGEIKSSRPLQDAGLRDLSTMLVTGIRDYAHKNGFRRAVLGISGGIDSALVATLACEALGPENVIGLVLPTKFSSVHSVEDAEELAAKTGLQKRHLPIKMIHSTFSMALSPFFAGQKDDATDENLQARIRGTAVMAFANKFQALALATGNKSEFAMGYTTLYGDMCGALAVIGDLYKTEVYALAAYLNSVQARIPERTLTKAPSAELRPNQTDQDSLPPYDLLDLALKLLVEEELGPLVALPRLQKEFPEADLTLLESIARTVRINEHKRKQAPPILRVSGRAFGSGRLYPLTCLY